MFSWWPRRVFCFLTHVNVVLNNFSMLTNRVFYFSCHTVNRDCRADQGGVCLVCGAQASDLNYGVISCERCKGFFKRSLSNKRVYKCRKQQRCQITEKERNRCQYCRLKKCLDQGMNSKGNYTMPSLPPRLQNDATQINLVTVSKFHATNVA